MAHSKDPPSATPQAPKIAIKGFSLSSSSSKKPSTSAKPKPPSSLGKRGRDTFRAEEESDSEDEGGRGRHEEVSGFGEGGAVRKGEEDGRRKRVKEELVIPKMGNRDWRVGKTQRGGGKNLLPEEVKRERAEIERVRNGGGEGKREGVDAVNGMEAEGKIKWGWSVGGKKKRVDNIEDHEVKEETKNGHKEGPEEVKEKTQDELAIEALMGVSSKPKADLVIHSQQTEDRPSLDEMDAYRAAVASAPEVSTLEDYERVPVEEFGAALLRGMGWKGELVKGGREVKRRQNLLGLGAKELKDAEELGAWVQKSDVKRLNAGGSKGGREKREREGGKMEEYRKERDSRRDSRRDRDDRRDDRRERGREREYGRDRDRDRRR